MSLWLSRKVVDVLEELLIHSASGTVASVAVVSLPRVCKALRSTRITATALETSDAIPSTDAYTAIVVSGIGGEREWNAKLLHWQNRLMPGGQLISLDRGSPQEVSRRFLCTGFTDLSQQMVARRLITSGSAVAMMPAISAVE